MFRSNITETFYFVFTNTNVTESRKKGKEEGKGGEKVEYVSFKKRFAAAGLGYKKQSFEPQFFRYCSTEKYINSRCATVDVFMIFFYSDNTESQTSLLEFSTYAFNNRTQ